MVKKVVLISTGQPATNPRLVKEADVLVAAGYEVTVLYCYFIQWASDFEKEWLPAVSWNHQLVGGSPSKKKLTYLFTRVRFKIARLVNKHLASSFLAERAQARAYDELFSAAKCIKADLYIGHNLGALAVAVKAAKFHVAKAGFDFEDYHRGEVKVGSSDYKRVVHLEKSYLPKLNYLSYSSPLIADAVQSDHQRFKCEQITLLNCFVNSSSTCPNRKSSHEKTLKLFWFSQTVGKFRGLEIVMKALARLNNPSITLTLVGEVSEETREYMRELAGPVGMQVNFKGVLPPAELPNFAAQHDIGLATEIIEPKNRNICLTNKVFTYLISGLCIVASQTAAQTYFFRQYPSTGFLYPQDDPEALAQLIGKLFLDRELLTICGENAFSVAKNSLNWQLESEKLKTTISKLLDFESK